MIKVARLCFPFSANWLRARSNSFLLYDSTSEPVYREGQDDAVRFDPQNNARSVLRDGTILMVC